jgi:tRNA (adenine57-N1/adenine58-N1)-methyltransferase
MIGHTGFLVTARRLADGVTPPVRRRRPSKGAYAADYLAEGATPAAGSVTDPEFNEDGTVTSSVARRVLP